MQKSASIRPRTSPSEFGGNYSILFKQILIQYSFVSLDKTKICTPGAASGGTMTFMTPAWGGGAAPGTPSAILKAVLMAASCPCGAGCTSASRNLVGIRQHFLANFEGPANGSIATDFYETNNSFSQDFRNLQEICAILHCSKLVESSSNILLLLHISPHLMVYATLCICSTELTHQQFHRVSKMECQHFSEKDFHDFQSSLDFPMNHLKYMLKHVLRQFARVTF